MDSPGSVSTEKYLHKLIFRRRFYCDGIGSVVLFVWHELLIFGGSRELLTCRLSLFHNTLTLVQQLETIKCLNYWLLSAFGNKATRYLDRFVFMHDFG